MKQVPKSIPSVRTLSLRISDRTIYRLKVAGLVTKTSIERMVDGFIDSGLSKLERKFKRTKFGRIAILASATHADKVVRGSTPEGYVYLIRAATGHYKIGGTKNIDSRLALFSVKLPFDVTFVHAIAVPNKRVGEKAAHEIFSSKRVNGEWFSLSTRDVGRFNRLSSEDLCPNV